MKELQFPSLKVFTTIRCSFQKAKNLSKAGTHIALKSLNWWRWWGCSTCRSSFANGTNFHLSEKLFRNIWCHPDAQIECLKHVVPKSSSCKVKAPSPLQGQVICGIIAALHTCQNDFLEFDKLSDMAFTFQGSSLILNGCHCDSTLQCY